MKNIKLGHLTLATVNDGTEYSVIECDKDAEYVEIPFLLDGLPVTSIGEYAFEDCKQLRSVIFKKNADPSYINSFEICDFAFNCCSALESIDIPDEVCSIGRSAFRNCAKLVSVKLPNSNIYVAPYAFCGCSSLKAITSIDNVSEGVFEDCTSLEHFPVAVGTTDIEEDAFRGCSSLVDITIPASVTSLEPLAFRSLSGLKRVTFEDPDGWSYVSIYTNKVYELDLSDPEKNAEILSGIDFDDGVGTWRKTKN